MFSKPKSLSISECIAECRSKRFDFIPEPFLNESVCKFPIKRSPYDVMLAIDLFNPDECYVEYEKFLVEDSSTQGSSDGALEQKPTYVYGCSVISRKHDCILVEAYGAEESFALNACCAKMICIFWGADEFAQILLQRYESSLTDRKLVIYSKPIKSKATTIPHNPVGDESSRGDNEPCDSVNKTELLAGFDKLPNRLACNKNLKRGRNKPGSNEMNKKRRFILQSRLTVDAFLEQPVDKSIMFLVSQFPCQPFKNVNCEKNYPLTNVFQRITRDEKGKKRLVKLKEVGLFRIGKDLTNSRISQVFGSKIVATSNGVTILEAYANKKKAAENACCAKYLQLVYGPDPIWSNRLGSLFHSTKIQGVLFDKPVEIFNSIICKDNPFKWTRFSNGDEMHIPGSKEHASSSEEGKVHDGDAVRSLRTSSRTVAQETAKKLKDLCCDNDLISDEDLKLQNAALRAEMRRKKEFLRNLKLFKETPSPHKKDHPVNTLCTRIKIERT